MPDERAMMDQVGRYWDALVLGHASEASDLEPELATTIERLRVLAERPTAAVRQRVWSDVLSNVEATSLPSREPWLHAIAPDDDASLPTSGQRGRDDAAPGRARWALAHLATAALILLTLVSSYIAFGPGRPARHEKPGLVPRVFYTPSPPDLHKDQEVAKFVWETGGGPDQPLGSIGFLTLDPDGNLWVADDTNLLFQIFDPDGRFLESWRPSGFGLRSTGAHGNLFSVAFDPAGLVYVVNPYAHRVEKYGEDRAFISSWGEKGSGPGQFLSPSSIAIDLQGQIYVEDAERSDIQMFAADGSYLRTLGEPGLGEGQFFLRYGGSIALDETGNVWVTDGGSQRIQKYSPDGRFLTSFGSYGTGEANLGAPGQAAVDRDGRLFVTDRVRQRVSVFDDDGSFIASWGAKGGNPGEFYAPYGIALDAKGFAYVADSDSRVQKFRLKPPLAPRVAAPATPDAAAGEPAVLIWETRGAPDLPLYRPGHIAVDPAGNIWVVDGSRNAFQIFSPDGDYLESWGLSGSGEGEFAFYDPVVMVTTGAVAFDRVGNIYVADAGNFRVQKFAPDRTFIASWGTRGTGNGQFLTPTHVTVDDRGFVYVTDGERHDVQVFDADGAYLRTIGEYGTGEGQLIMPLDGAVAVDANGNIWVADKSNHRIQKFDPDGTFRAAFGGFGYGDGKFSSPNDVVIDSEGRVFVGDVARTGVRVQVFSPDGEFLASWSDSEGISSGGASLALDRLGNIYVSDYNGDRIQKFALKPPLAPDPVVATATPAREALLAAEFLWETRGGPDQPFENRPLITAIDPQGNIWVLDGPRHQFQIFRPDGTFLETWGSAGTGPGEFNFLSQIYGNWPIGAAAFDASGNLYVVDSGNKRIQKFDANRTFDKAWGGEGRGDGQFMWPDQLAIDGRGRIYVPDEARHDVQVFDSDGAHLSTIGQFGQGEGEFNLPTVVTIDTHGNLWVADIGNYRIQKFDPEGRFATAWGQRGVTAGSFSTISGLVVDDEDRVYVTDAALERVQVFTADGEPIASWGGAGADPGEFYGPTGIFLDGSGRVYVGDFGNERIQAFQLLPPLAPAAQPAAGEAPIDASPVAELLWITSGPPEQPLDHPGMLAVDSEGNVWLPHQPSNQIQIYSPDGEYLEAWGTPGSGDGQFDFSWEEEQVGGGAVAFDREGNIYVVEKGNHRVQKFAPDRTFLLNWGKQGTGVGEFVVPESIAIDREGRGYVSDGGRDDIQVFDSEGNYLSTIGSFGMGDGQFYFFCGSGLAFAPNGDLLVSEGCNHRVQRFSPAGEHLATFGGFGAAAGQLSQVQQIAVDAEGRIFVADYSSPNNRIQVLTPDGTPLAQWGQEELGPVFGPVGLGIDGEGVVYISDIDDDRLMAFRLLPPLSE